MPDDVLFGGAVAGGRVVGVLIDGVAVTETLGTVEVTG
jgi:hypothetical protein